MDKNIYEPHLCESGVNLDSGYERVIKAYGDTLWQNKSLLEAGKSFAALHKAQYNAVKEGKGIANRKGFRNKAMTESVISAWAFISGLLQNTPERLQNHYSIPKTNKAVPDPLNAGAMSTFRHDSDDPTYRGLGTRSALKDRQRMAQLFLAKSLHKNGLIDKSLMNKAVSTVVGIKSLQKGYTV